MAVAQSEPSSAAASLTGLARALMQAGRLPTSVLQAAQRQSSLDKSPFIEVLLKSGHISSSELAGFCSEAFGFPVFDLREFDLSTRPEKLVDTKLMLRLRALPLSQRGNRVAVAISDPTQVQSLDQIQFQTASTVEPVIVQHDALMQILDGLGRSTEQSLNDMVDDSFDVDLLSDDTQSTSEADTSEIDDAPVVRFLQKILLDAINVGASDIHFEPFEKFYRIRLRVDGELIEHAQPPVAIKEKLSARIKVLSRLDISEKRVPQDGRMKLALSPTRAIDFRVSTLPTLFGEKLVLRILDASSAQLGIDALGYEPDQREIMLNAIQRPYGMVLVTGPTGSGKTVSLYTCLNILNKPGINIATAEDPAEINLPGVNQVNVNERAGLTFAVALRAFLRQDPDVVMVGEIRDLETADIAIKAAQTGHMVFSTLHTNDAASTLTRLMNMGVAPFNIASSVILITAQRLARRLCTCKRPAQILDAVLLQAGFRKEELDGSWTPFEPAGCERCTNTGYRGRVGIYEIMPITESIERIILNHGSAMEIETQARKDGVKSLRQSGLLKVKQGLTSLEEVLGCTNE
ncbi:MAG: type IV-A pilus assembly ATPase PilB [Oxalobacter sp.]|nr:MAG: type IV-A pilus assembly ATPase PilB [Oxalobacter sp.]